MPIVNVEPTDEHPVPFSTDDDVPASFMEELAVAGNTAELQVGLGAQLVLDYQSAQQEKALIKETLTTRSKSAGLKNPMVAFAAAEFLRSYGQQVALDVAQARAAITHKLMELANCGDPKYELRALELLGKHSDIGLFTERSEITINYKDPGDLENAIKERVKRLLNAEVVDVTPIGADLDELLGTHTPENQEPQEEQQEEQEEEQDEEQEEEQDEEQEGQQDAR